MTGPLYFLYRGMYLPKFFYTPEAVQHWEEFTFRPNDVIVATYPKSGTNWMVEMVPLVLSGGEPSLVNSMATWDRTAAVGTVQALSMDLENCPSPRIFSTHYYYNILPKSFYQVKPKVIYVMRNPKDVLVSAFYYYGRVEYHTNPGSLKEFLHKFLEGDGTNWMLEMVPLVLSGGEPSLVNSMATWDRTAVVGTVQALSMDLENCPSPRIFSTHYYYNILPKSFYQVKPKVIYIMRNPKDVLVSAFYYYGRVEYHTNPGSLKEFLHKFLEGDVPYCNWFDQTKSWLTVEDKSHILYLTYEEMIQDLRQVVSRTAEFLEKPLEEEQIDRISDRCLFNNMKKHITNIPSKLDHSLYFRKGIVGDWKNHLAEEDAQYFDTVYKEKMKDIDFKFRWD